MNISYLFSPRIRFAIIKHIPLLAEQLGKDFFSEKLASLCVGWLGDDIATIRTAAASNLRDLTKLFGDQWAIEYILPSIEEIRFHTSYLRRLTALNACALMMTVMEPAVATTELLPLVLEMSTDAVANIRFNVAKGLQQTAPILGNHVYSTQIEPILGELVDDPDRDVRYFSKEIVKELEEMMKEP